jgi:hypothetical protein
VGVINDQPFDSAWRTVRVSLADDVPLHDREASYYLSPKFSFPELRRFAVNSVCGAIFLVLSALPAKAGMFDIRDTIILTPWDQLRGAEGILTIDEAARGIKASGHNMAAVMVGPRDLDACQKNGLFAIVRDPRVSAYDWKNIDPELVERNVKSLVDEIGAHPAVFGFYVMDEPSAQHFAGLAVVVNALAKYAPGKLAYINLYPDYATINNSDHAGQLGVESYQEYLDSFVKSVPTQVISYDNYSITNDYSVLPSYFRNLVLIRETAQKAGRTFWNVVTSNQVRAFRGKPTLASLAFQAYSTLAGGGRGVAYFTYFTGDKSVKNSGGYAAGPLWNFRPTPTWDYLSDVNHSIHPILSLLSQSVSTGIGFAPSPPVDSLPSLPGKVIISIESQGQIMVGEFRHADGSDYVMLVNCDLLNPAWLELELGKGIARLEATVLAGGSIFEDGKRVFLRPGWGLLLKAQRLTQYIEKSN